jgi:hypothetical protein
MHPKAAAPWPKVLGGPGDDMAAGLALDAHGNVYLAGGFRQTLSVGAGSLTSSGGSDAFVVSYSPSGAELWSRSFGASGDDAAEALAVDARGNLVLGGTFAQTVSFGGAGLTASGGRDIFVASIGARAGAHRWSRSAGGPSGKSAESVLGAALDGQGNVYFTGRFSRSVDFGGGALLGRKATDVYLTSYTVSGQHRWSQAFGGSGSDWGAGLAARSSGLLAAIGVHGPSFQLGALETSKGGTFVASFAHDGTLRWARALESSGRIQGEGVAFHGPGNLVVIGQYSGTASFGSGPLTSAGGTDVFLASFDDKGAPRWVRSFGGSGADAGRSVTVDARGNIHICATFTGQAAFGGSTLVSRGGRDIVVASFDERGAHRWSKRYGGPQHDSCAGVAVGGGAVYVAGAFRGTADLGNGSRTSKGGYDVFLSKIDTAP